MKQKFDDEFGNNILGIQTTIATVDLLFEASTYYSLNSNYKSKFGKSIHEIVFLLYSKIVVK